MKAWKIAVLILVGALAVYHLERRLFLWFPGSDANMASFSEAMVRASHNHRLLPPVLCLGSSRIRHGLAPEVIETAYGLTRGSVQNYGMDVGTPWMALKFLENTSLLSPSLQLVFLDVEPWQFNGAFAANTIDRQIFYRLASLSEKMRVGSLRQRAFFLADMIVPFMSENRPLKSWAEGVQYLVSEKAVLALDVPHAWRRRGERLDERFSPATAAERHMEGYLFSERLKQALLELVDRLTGRGVAVVLFQLPATNGYTDAIEQTPAFREAYDNYVEWLRSFHHPEKRVWLRLWERPEELGLDDTDFIDYGHLSRDAAKLFTSRFVAALPAEVGEIISAGKVAREELPTTGR